VTGRILDELRADFPDVERWFDAIVAENGAVVHRPGAGTRVIATPVAGELATRLASHGVPFRRGQALLATDSAHSPRILGEIERLGLDCQLLGNRGALMVLPSGVSKGSGLRDALAELGVSSHSAIGIGDAENDHSLLAACELGVAVANAIQPLKDHADVVLTEPIARFLAGPIEALAAEPRRWRIVVGLDDEGLPVTLPASRANVVVTGASGLGKSYLAGAMAEQLIQQGYGVCLFDPEGDHAPLGKLRGVVSVGGHDPPPSPEQLARLTALRFGSVVVDLSLQPSAARTAYTRAALAELRRRRADTGVPHWIFVDEAHVPLVDDDCVDPEQTGLCLVTYRADLLHPTICAAADYTITLEDVERGRLERGGSLVGRFRPSPRVSRHVRHRHKYGEAALPERYRFAFRTLHGLTGRSAANLLELDAEIARAAPDVIAHHASRHDFSRWIRDVISDRELAERAFALESQLATDPALSQLRRAIEDRYLEE
jgi:hypothetical protein